MAFGGWSVSPLRRRSRPVCLFASFGVRFWWRRQRPRFVAALWFGTLEQGSPLPHPHREWVYRRRHPHREWGVPMSTLHLSCRRLTAEAHLCRDWGSLCHICTGTRQVAAAECGGAYPFASDPAAAADFALRVLRGSQRAPAARGRHTCHTTRRMRAAPTPLGLGEYRRSTYGAALSRLRRFMLPRWSATRVVAAVLAESGVSPAEKMRPSCLPMSTFSLGMHSLHGCEPACRRAHA